MPRKKSYALPGRTQPRRQARAAAAAATAALAEAARGPRRGAATLDDGNSDGNSDGKNDAKSGNEDVQSDAQSDGNSESNEGKSGRQRAAKKTSSSRATRSRSSRSRSSRSRSRSGAASSAAGARAGRSGSSHKAREGKPDGAPSVQQAVAAALAEVSADPRDEVGAGEAALLGLRSNVARQEEITEEELAEEEELMERDKAGERVHTLDNFAVYDEDGHLVDLRDVWLMPGLMEDLTVYGTVVAPLRFKGTQLVRTPRPAPTKNSCHEQVIEMLDSKLMRIAASGKKLAGYNSGSHGTRSGTHNSSSSSAAATSSAGGSNSGSKSAIKVPHFDPSLSRDAAFEQARKLTQATTVPFTVGGITVLDLGEIHLDRKYYSSKHLFPVGYRSQRQYTCAVSPTEKAVYTSEILEGVEGPRFRVTHENGDLSWEEASSSAVWLQVLRHVNDCKVRNGLPAKGTAISGPEMFGFANAKIASVLEGLDGVPNCTNYTFRATRGGGYGGMHTRNRRLDELDGSGQGEAYYEDASVAGDDNASTVDAGNRRKSRSRASIASITRKPKTMTVKDTQYITRAGAQLQDLQEKEVKGLRVLLKKLATCNVNADLLHDTGAAKVLKRLRKHPDKKIAHVAKEIVRAWKSKGDKETTKKDIAIVTDCCAKIITFIGLGPDEKMQDAVAEKYVKNARGAQRKKIFEFLVRLDRIKFVDTETLISTNMGKTIGRLRKHLDPDICALALNIKERWQRQLKDPDGEQYVPSPAQLMTFKDFGAGNGLSSSQDAEGSAANHDDDDNDIHDDDDDNDNHATSNSSKDAKTHSKRSRSRRANGNHNYNEDDNENDFDDHGDEEDDSKSQAMDIDTPAANSKSSKKRKRGSNAASTPVEVDPETKEEDNLRARKRARRSKNPGKDSLLKKVSNFDSEEMTKAILARDRQRVKITRVTRVSMTLSYGDPTLWLETENARYRLAGSNVPVTPAVHYADTFAHVWKIFEACHRFLHIIDMCERTRDLNSILLEATQDITREMPRRKAFKDGDESAESEFEENSVQLTEADILECTYYIVEELHRMLANEPERIPKVLQMKAMNDFITRGLHDMDRSTRNYIKRERLRILEEAKEASKTEKQRERDAQRRELEQRRMIENGVGLPDDLEVVEEDLEREASGEKIASAYVAALAEKEAQTIRPVPRFMPCDPAFVEFDHLLQYEFISADSEGNFKHSDLGCWAGAKPGTFNVEGMRFAMMLQLWSTMRTILYNMDNTFIDRDAFAQESFAIFRERFAKSGADDICMALVKYLCDQGGSEDDPSSRAGNRIVYGVEDTAGISTRRGRSHRKQIQLAGHDAAVPSYPYNSDELWPAPSSMINEIAWPEIARRMLLHQLRTDEDLYLAWQFNPDNQHPGQPPRKHRELTHACLDFEPDLLSTCDELLMEIMDDQSSPPFCVPVDPKIHDAPNYFEIIKRPMDLDTIRKRMHNGHYDPENAPEGNRYQEVVDWRRGTTSTDDDEEDGASQRIGAATPAPEEDVDPEDVEVDVDGEDDKPIVEDLTTMDARLYEFDCLGGGHEGVAADVRQVFRNCRRFNKSHTKLYNDARKLDGMFARVYEDRVIRRDPKYRPPPIVVLPPADADGANGDGNAEVTSPMAALKLRRGNKFVDVDKAENTKEYAGPFQKGIPILQEALLSLNQYGDYSLLSVDEKLRIATALTDMAMDTRAMRSSIQLRIEELHRLSREQQQVQRDVQRAEKDLTDASDQTHSRKEELEATRIELERQIRERAIRLEPVGFDRHFNRYWAFDALALPVVFVEIARTGAWGVLWSADEVKQLLASLDIRGARENALHRALSDLWASYLRDQAEAQQEYSEGRISEYIKGKVESNDGVSRVVKLAQIQLEEAEKRLEEAAEAAKIWRKVETEDGRAYYYHVDTRETTWDVPELHKAEDEEKLKVEECRANVEKAKEDPEEALEALTQDLMNDNLLIHALATDAPEIGGGVALTADDLHQEEVTFLNKARVNGFIQRVLHLVAGLLALESLTVGHGANPNLSCRKDEWLGRDQQTIWFNKTKDIIKILEGIENDPNPAWVQIRSILVDVLHTFFDLFVGSPYSVTHDKAQRAVIMASRHEYRYHRALREAQNLADFGLLFGQLQNILHMKRTVPFLQAKEQYYNVLLKDVTATREPETKLEKSMSSTHDETAATTVKSEGEGDTPLPSASVKQEEMKDEEEEEDVETEIKMDVDVSETTADATATAVGDVDAPQNDDEDSSSHEGDQEEKLEETTEDAITATAADDVPEAASQQEGEDGEEQAEAMEVDHSSP